MLVLVNCFSRRADMFPITSAEFTVELAANTLVNQYIPLRGLSHTILSDNGLKFCSNLLEAIDNLLGMRKLASSSYHPKSHSTAAPPNVFQRNRPFHNGLPVVSPEIRCPATPQRHRSIGLCIKENIWMLRFQSYPPLCRAAMKRSSKKIAGFWGGYRRMSPNGTEALSR